MAALGRFAAQHRVELAGSERKPFVVGAEAAAAKKAATGRVKVSVVVKPKAPVDAGKLGDPKARMTRAAFATRHGANPESVKLVKTFAKEFGLTAEPVAKPGRCTVLLSGTVAAMQKAFGVTLVQQQSDEGLFRVREGAITLPEELAGHVVAVLGLDNRPQAKPHFRVAVPHATNVSYTPVQVAEMYGFPQGVSATGQTIGLIELGGGYRAADITAYFKTL